MVKETTVVYVKVRLPMGNSTMVDLTIITDDGAQVLHSWDPKAYAYPKSMCKEWIDSTEFEKLVKDRKAGKPTPKLDEHDEVTEEQKFRKRILAKIRPSLVRWLAEREKSRNCLMELVITKTTTTDFKVEVSS